MSSWKLILSSLSKILLLLLQTIVKLFYNVRFFNNIIQMNIVKCEFKKEIQIALIVTGNWLLQNCQHPSEFALCVALMNQISYMY